MNGAPLVYRLPPALVGVVVLVVTAAEAANVGATLFLGKGDLTFHAVFLAVMTAVGLAVKPATGPDPRKDDDAGENDDMPRTRQRGGGHRA